MLIALLCLAFAGWTAKPDLAHLPKLLTVLQDHAEMVAEHGHSHGFEADLAWALHGHSHDGADHEHGGEVVMPLATAPAPSPAGPDRGLPPARDGPSPVFRLDRPPRA